MTTRFTWNANDIEIRPDDGLPERLRKIIEKAPAVSSLKAKYYLDQLKNGNLSQKELNYILARGL